MHRFIPASLSLACALSFSFVCPSVLPAQQEGVGSIARIAEILGGRTEREIKQPTTKVQTRRAGAERWENAAPRAALSADELLRVERFVDARLHVDRRAQNGTLVFLPELFRRGGELVFPAATGAQLAEGVYRIAAESSPTDDLVVALQQGALVVDWAHGRLIVDAAGTRTVITGTRLAISADAEGENGFLFLQSGSISFPEHPEVNVRAGELVRLQRGEPPIRLPLEGTEAQALREAIRYHNQQVWARVTTPFWKRPVFFLPAAAAVVGGAVIAVAGGGGDGPSEGTVIIRFPPR